MASRVCRGLIAFMLKFLNFLQAFVGVAIILCSIWMLNHWNHQHHAPPSAPSPESDQSNMLRLYSSEFQENDRFFENPYDVLARKVREDMTSGLETGFNLNFKKLPDPWFIYSFMSIGVLLCLITCVGHIAAETINSCCLCSYTVLTTVLIILEGALVCDILFNKHWEKDIPDDPTGEFDNLKSFLKGNLDICKGVVLSVITIQALSLLLAMILRGMVPRRREDYDSDDDDYFARSNYRQPLLHQGAHVTASTSMDNKNNRIDSWSTRMRDKYGLNPGEFGYGGMDPKASQASQNRGEDQGRCSIM